MIVSGILYIIYLFVSVVLLPIRLLPSVTVDAGVGAAITNAVTYIANWNGILPLATLFTIIGLLLTIETAIALYKIVMWLIRRIPTQS